MKRLLSASAVLLAMILAGCASVPLELPPAEGPPAQVQPEPAKPAEQTATAADPAAQQPPQAVAQPQIPERAAQQFAQAIKLLESNKLTEAELELKQLALAYPQFAGPYVNLGLLYARTGKLPEAEQAFQEAIKRDAVNLLAYTQLGVVYRKLGRFKDAERAYGEALKIDANYAPAQLNLGVLCDLYLQQPAKALQAYERYQQIMSQPAAMSANGDEQLLKQVANWVAELKRRLGSNPQPQASGAGA